VHDDLDASPDLLLDRGEREIETATPDDTFRLSAAAWERQFRWA